MSKVAFSCAVTISEISYNVLALTLFLGVPIVSIVLL